MAAQNSKKTTKVEILIERGDEIKNLIATLYALKLAYTEFSAIDTDLCLERIQEVRREEIKYIASELENPIDSEFEKYLESTIELFIKLDIIQKDLMFVRSLNLDLIYSICQQLQH